MEQRTLNLVPHADVAVEVKVTSTMLTNTQVSEFRKSLSDSLKLLLPDYKGGTIQSTNSLKLLDSGLVLVVQSFLFEAFIDGGKLQGQVD